MSSLKGAKKKAFYVWIERENQVYIFLFIQTMLNNNSKKNPIKEETFI